MGTMPAPRSPAWTTRLFAAGAIVSFAASLASACGSSSATAATTTSTASAGGAGGAGGDTFVGSGGGSGPPPPDAGYLCGQAITHVVKDPPNLYFVLDASGSMTTPVDGSTRYALVQQAAVGLVQKLGGLINVGVAIFPYAASQNQPCHPGEQVLPLTPGDKLDPATFADVTNVLPYGGTPTAASLQALHGTITKLPGRTIVIVATDGGPNCNGAAMCPVTDCMPNVESSCDDQGNNCCKPTGPNCCAPDAAWGPFDCIDRKATVDAVAALSKAGVRVYVVGIPGSEIYGSVLDDMALAGGAPQIAPPFYYKVDDFGNLGGVLGSIAAIEVSCDLDLGKPPADPNQVNVYLDQDEIPYDPADGWMWKLAFGNAPKQTVELRGASCAKLKLGEVKEVQVAVGCPTKATK
jgi:von Willebrand factor type A domain